ncbi:MAG: HAMP domain-containing histidine kinase [Candidatus Pristimantibacillus lignocellulolyticus]|uniref:Heme sensor protein HssS n=1 Tax=Candidatus Pristimantibacillus lignocellulolyticus TaxID=2994561 RepID=A0A9J6ZBX0_9BACL|nr:MAG: HAMP domain-containing histidine kinase [Candidatus Pristimantibacillus lignocellulolyticus]
MRTLYRQFTVATLFIVVISVTVGLFIVSLVYNILIKEKNDAHYVAIATQVTEILEQTHGSGFEVYLQSVAKLGYQVHVSGENGNTFSFGEPFHSIDVSQTIRELIYSGEVYHGMRDYHGKFLIFNHYANEIENTIGVPFEHNGERYALFIRPNNQVLFSDMHSLIAGFLVAMAIIVLLSMLWLARQLVKPIRKLSHATKHIMEENYQVEIDIVRSDELGQLAENFKQMVHRLKKNDEARKTFVSNVSHDFQSPLLNIQGYADLLGNNGLTTEEQQSYLQVIDQEAKRLSNLTKQLLLLTSLDHAARPLKNQLYELDQQLKKIIHKYRWRMEEQQVELSYEIEPISFYGDADLLEQVWDNVLTNAIKYNRNAGEINIIAKAEHDEIIIQFMDSGIGIAKEEIEHIFERFYRVDNSRSKDGTGLGLSIVKEIVELHQGKIEVISELDSGTTITIILPIDVASLGKRDKEQP